MRQRDVPRRKDEPPRGEREPAGYEQPERAEKQLQRLAAVAGLSEAALASLDRLCRRSADPDGALAGAARALEARFERLGGPAREASLPPLVLIASASKFLAAHLAARPRLLDLLAHPRFSRRARSAASALKAALRLLRDPRDARNPGAAKEPGASAEVQASSRANASAIKSLEDLNIRSFNIATSESSDNQNTQSSNESRGGASGAGGSVERFHARLRRHKLVEILRIALRDLSGRAPIPESTAELSRLAAGAFEAAVRFHYRRLCAAHGTPAGSGLDAPSGFCVLGMGKLGGEELNFSSDVDVLYVYDKDGRTAGDAGGRGAIDHFAFYAKLAEEVTRAVGAALEGGFVFRVDLDLRPEGRSGPVVNSLRGLELYYEAQGADWERFAWLKARPIAGAQGVGEAALRAMQPFVYRKYLDIEAIRAMRALKARAERESAKRGGVDLKLGPGGIREVEFFCQALQLLHGGRDPNLRERNTLRALERLLFAGLISARDRDALSEAYLLLRTLEHRVQMVAERQTHQLPAEPAELGRLARRSGLATREELERALARHRGEVQSRFSDLLRVARDDEPEQLDANALIAADPQSEPQSPEVLEALRALGFAQPDAAALELARMRKRKGTPFSPAAPPELAARAPWLLAELAKVPDPDRALRHLADLFGQLAQPSATARLFAGSPRTARLLLSLFGASDFLSRSLLRHPELIDQLVHRGSAPLSREKAELRALMYQRVEPFISPLEPDVEAALSELRRFHNEEILRIGLHDVAGALDPEAAGEQLSDLADVCVESCLALAQRETERVYGKLTPRAPPAGPPEAPGATVAAEAAAAGHATQGLHDNKVIAPRAAPSLVVIALGRLGGRELGYHSDLDLIFLYDGEGETAGPRKAQAHEQFARIAQKMISHLSLALPEGILYRIDTRLRPSGNAGPLVVSFDALARYHGDLKSAPGPGESAPRVAWTWERQALLRARAVAGDLALFDRAKREVLGASLFRPLDEKARAETARELYVMRERMEREIADESGARYNSKLGRGGLVDVEFAVQLLQLVHGHDHPAIRSPSTPAALAALAAEGILGPHEAEPLARGWRFLRRLESRLRIVRDRSVAHLPQAGRELAQLARRLGYSGDEAQVSQALLDDYQRATQSVRAAFLRVVSALTPLPAAAPITSEP